LMQARRSSFPQEFGAEAEDHQRSAEMITTLARTTFDRRSVGSGP
jgi:hypothetical protein